MDVSQDMYLLMRVRIIQRLMDWVESVDDADQPFIGTANGETLTARQILAEVEESTDLGETLIERWIQLTVDQIVTEEFET